MRIEYIVVAFRSAPDLAACLDAIAADAPPHAAVSVIDNASPDDSASIAAAHPVKPTVLSSLVNLGFGGACNMAARSSDADWLFFVNPDARLHPGATAALLAALQASPAVGAAGPRIIDPTGLSRAVTAGAEPSVRSVLGHYLLASRIPGVGRLFPPLHLPEAHVATRPDWIGGAAMLVRRDAFEAVGGFDARMFLYMEDVDLCRRLRMHGWSIAYEPSAVADHRMGGSQDASQPARWYAAFHAYVARQHGTFVARTCSAIAAIGLGARGLVYRRAKPSQGRRLSRAARVAARLAVGPAPAPHAEATLDSVAGIRR